MASAPAARTSSQIASVIPKPPAAFSPLITTQSSRHRSRRAGRRSNTALRPGRPTTSPIKNRRMTRTSGSYADAFGFRDHETEPSVVGLERHLRDLLDRIAKADGENRMPGREGRDGAVEMALAVPDPPAASVEAGERDDESLRKAFRRVGPRFLHAQPAFGERIARAPRPPDQVRIEDLRERDALAALRQAAKNRPRVDLAVNRPVAAHRIGVLEIGESQGPPGDFARRLLTPGLVERIAARESLLPQSLLQMSRDLGRRRVVH